MKAYLGISTFHAISCIIILIIDDNGKLSTFTFFQLQSSLQQRLDTKTTKLDQGRPTVYQDLLEADGQW